MTYAKTMWLLFVGWLMRITFGFGPADVLEQKRELCATRVKLDAMKIAHARAREDASQMARQNGKLRREYESVVDVAFEKQEEAAALREILARAKVLS